MSYKDIKKVALKLFSQKGFEGTTIKEIAYQAGLKPSSIYSHITTKEALFMEIWDECINNTLKSVEPLFLKTKSKELCDSREILYLYYRCIVTHFIKNKQEYLFLKQATFFTNNKNIIHNSKTKDFLEDDINVKYFSQFFMDLQKNNVIIDSDPNDLFFSYIGVMIAYLEGFLVYNIKVNSDHIDKFWNVFWRGIKI